MSTTIKKYLGYDGLSNVADKIKERLQKATTMPASPSNGDAVLYVGATTSSYTNGFIYIYDSSTSSWRAAGGSGGPSSASNVSYDNTTSGLQATNVQDAIDEDIGKTEASFAIVQGILGEKADIVSNPTSGNFAGLDANGNLTDSGSKASDFLTIVNLTSDVTGILPIASGGTGNAGGYIRTGQKSGTTVGSRATCEGQNTTASGSYSHAEGSSTTASEHSSHAEGQNTTASGKYSHAEGHSTTASGIYSHAQNYETRAESACQTAIGKYNVSDANNTYALIIGNGTATNARSDALRVDWSGNVQIDGEIKGLSGNRKYVAEPSSEGTSGQVLKTDGAGGRTWGSVIQPTILTSTTISASTTSYTFTDSAITADSVIDIYDTIFGFSPTNITVSAGSAIITFPAQSASHTIKLFVY